VDDVNANEKVTLMNQLSGMPSFTRVTCEAKVVQVDKIRHTSGGTKMQNATISDGEGIARNTIWESEVGMLEVNKTYKVSRIMMIREDRSKQLYFSMAKTNCSIDEIK